MTSYNKSKIQWCDSCENIAINQICFKCEAGFCDECYEEHLTIHEVLQQ